MILLSDPIEIAITNFSFFVHYNPPCHNSDPQNIPPDMADQMFQPESRERHVKVTNSQSHQEYEFFQPLPETHSYKVSSSKKQRISTDQNATDMNININDPISVTEEQ